MQLLVSVCVLIAAAVLECGGDALVRAGLSGRAWMLFAGAASLFVYGVVVNKAGADFGRLMGAYIAVFFLVSQVISIACFRQFPIPRTIVAGSLIVAGGVLMII